MDNGRVLGFRDSGLGLIGNILELYMDNGKVLGLGLVGNILGLYMGNG